MSLPSTFSSLQDFRISIHPEIYQHRNILGERAWECHSELLKTTIDADWTAGCCKQKSVVLGPRRVVIHRPAPGRRRGVNESSRTNNYVLFRKSGRSKKPDKMIIPDFPN